MGLIKQTGGHPPAERRAQKNFLQLRTNGVSVLLSNEI